MKCCFGYCIYNKNLECMLYQIEIDNRGQCNQCNIVSVPMEKIEEYKLIHLQEVLNEINLKLIQKYDLRIDD